MKARSVDELLGVTVECPALQKFQVEVVRPAEDRVGTSGAGDNGEDRYLHAVDQAARSSVPSSSRGCRAIATEPGTPPSGG